MKLRKEKSHGLGSELKVVKSGHCCVDENIGVSYTMTDKSMQRIPQHTSSVWHVICRYFQELLQTLTKFEQLLVNDLVSVGVINVSTFKTPLYV